MTIIDLTAARPEQQRCELVWDLPNQTTTLVEIHQGPGKPPRIEFEALGGYVAEAADSGQAVAATVFANVRPKATNLAPFLMALRKLGFGVFAKPQICDSDIDDELVDHVRTAAPALDRLFIGTHDKQLIQRCLDAVTPDCAVTVLGFAECSTFAATSTEVDFVDLEDIPGMFATPLVRSSLRCLPPEGAYLPPLAPLGARSCHVA